MSSSVSSARGQLLSLGEAAEGVDVCLRSLRALGVRCGVGNGSTDAIAITAAELKAKIFGWILRQISVHDQRTFALDRRRRRKTAFIDVRWLATGGAEAVEALRTASA